MPRSRDTHDVLEVYVTEEGLAALRKHNFPCSEALVASATPTEYGIRLTGKRYELDSLAGWTAGEANYSRKKRRTRQTRTFDELSDAIESALGSGFAFGGFGP